MIESLSLRAARINRNMTIENAAAKVGLSARQLYRLEAGETIPKWGASRSIWEPGSTFKNPSWSWSGPSEKTVSKERAKFW